ncbi:MAG: RlmE family RNA methyltransferase [Thaumarchaeota archaeon]|nr:RlmE family RNA methyltransferase [Nitrososphaerota archaeon]
MRLEEAKRDHYRKLAREEGYRSRASYKLIQINRKYRLIRPGAKVVDVGCAPGGWLEVSSELVGTRGLVVGVDIVHVKPVGSNVKILREDVSADGFGERLIEALGKRKADCVLADLSPKLSGVWDVDHFRQMELCNKVVDMYGEILVLGGSSVMKAFQGNELPELMTRLKASFSRVEISKPEASRKQSSEVYLVGLGFTGRAASGETEPLLQKHQSGLRSDSDGYDWQSDRLT